MTEVFSKFKAKLKEIFYDIPMPKLWPQKELHEYTEGRKPNLCQLCYKGNDPNQSVLPDDFRDIKLERNEIQYDIKLVDIEPAQWMLVGTNLLNMAFEDPNYGAEAQDIPEKEVPYPPPPEQSEYIKKMKEPKITLNLKGLSWPDLEDLGRTFYELGLTHQRKYDIHNWDDLPFEPTCDEVPDHMAETMDEYMFDPVQKVMEEVTRIKTVTNSDVLPDVPHMPYKDDAEAWMENASGENPRKDEPPWPKPEEGELPIGGSIYPMQTHL